ncbi:hypothetical protein L1887_05902 [Cichorium endivia]|nr:hypothetical protein L1887_05902 [Cichorium endivia]
MALKSITQITASTHFPIRLTPNNFPVWRRQVESTLIGLELDAFIIGDQQPPKRFLDDKKQNPEFLLWYRQDQVIISAILGSCSDSIQPLISSATTSRDAWERLNSSFASGSRYRIISLKSKLIKNPKGSRSISEYLQDMRSIADDLALAQSPVAEEDLLVHILSQLGEEYITIVAAIKVRENPLSYPELFDKLTDFERALKETSSITTPPVTTVNYTARQHNRQQSNGSFSRPNRSNNRNHYNQNQGTNSFSNGNRQTRNNTFCQFCNIPGHNTRDCRKLSRFLRDNNITITSASPAPPVANVTTSGSSPISPTWLFDSGASNHVTSDRSTLQNLSDYGGPDEIILGDGNRLQISHIGSKHINTLHKPLSLPNVLCVPRLRRNLISVAKLCKTNQVSVEFFPTHFFVKDLSTGAPLLRGENSEDVYHARLPSNLQLHVTTKSSPLTWHHKLGHPSFKVFKTLVSSLGLNSKSFFDSHIHCPSCSINKSHKLPFGPNSFTATKPLQLLYSDVWGPVQSSIDHFTYYVIFVDYFSKYVWFYPLKRKSDVATIFPQFKLLVEKFFGSPLVSIFTDNGGEYQGLQPFLQSHGISHYTTPPHTPEQNGVAERRHRHIVETGLALLHYAKLPLTYWTHAFQTAVYLINRLPTHVLHNQSPFQRLFHTPPNYTRLKPFGCLCYPWLKPYSSSKLHPKSTPCLFLGYSTSKSAYKCFDPLTKRLYHSRHVQFIEHIFPSHGIKDHNLPSTDDFLKPSTPPSDTQPMLVPPAPSPTPYHPATTTNTSLPDTQPSTQHPTSPQTPADTPLPSSTSPPTFRLTYSRRSEQHAQSSNPIQTPPPTAPFHSTSPSISTSHISTTSDNNSSTPPTIPPSPNTSPSHSTPSILPPRTRKQNPKYFNPSFINSTTLHPIPPTLEPTTYNQALKDPNWRHAMDQEFNALLQNGTWELVPKASHNPIGCKWIFRIKRNPDGSISKYKARLVAKGFLQQYGKDYFDTFSPVTKPVTIRVILSIALSKNWPLRQLDVNNAFLHGTLHEEVFMTQPPGFAHPQFPNHVCKLRKSLYGLKQAPRAWYIELTSFLLSCGFRKSQADASLFIYNHSNVLCFFMVYVDDIVLTGNNTNFLNQFIQSLANRFSIKDLGALHHFLGIEVIPTSHGLFLSQHRHIQDLLTKFHMDGAKEVATPLNSSTVLAPMDGSPSVDPTPYRKLVGSLQYLAFTRPDVSYAINRLAQFMHAPSQIHWQALKRVLRYLKGTIYHGLFLKRDSSLTLNAFLDSDWGGVLNGGRSTTAYIVYLGSNIISWKSAKQKSVSRSSTEAEYKALANASAEVSWVQNLLTDLGVTTTSLPKLFCDNTGATYLCANPVYHSHMKHVALDYHFVREKVADGSLKVLHINSHDQLADALTKPLNRAPFLRLRSKIGVSDGSSILRGRITTK